jgi:hemerythrin
MRSPSGSLENKEQMIEQQQQGMPKSPAYDLVQISGKKKATYEMDAELHQWLKKHCVAINKTMIEVLEEQIRKYRADVEGR